ncbi:MAG TPA: GNAT family N-acetyltransferase [Trebonia sp.]|jgi:RimJ/RimL family protein N-acetyltransferase
MSAAASAFRPATASDLDRVAALIVPDAASPLTAGDFRARLDSGEYRADRVWVAEASDGHTSGGTAGTAIAAAAVWWGRTGEHAPGALDALVADPGLPREQRAAVGSQLLAVAHETFTRSLHRMPASFHFLLPCDWRSRHDVVSALSWRWEAALRAGLTDELERLRFEWRAETGLPETRLPETGRGRRPRLTFRREPDDDAFATLFRRALKGTLDATTRKTADVVGDGIQAHADVAFYRDRMEGDRRWWIVAELQDGEPVGFGVPNRNSESAVVGYIGVLPEYRGQGYVDEILAETTRILATEGQADRVQADTDLANQPMAAAFERAGYVNFARRVVLSPPLR